MVAMVTEEYCIKSSLHHPPTWSRVGTGSLHLGSNTVVKERHIPVSEVRV